MAPGGGGAERAATRVLGVDAAWTTGQPSGLALVDVVAGRPRLQRVARSYAEAASTLDGASIDWMVAPAAGGERWADAFDAWGDVTVAALDMPLATGAITGRRACDDALSSAYGGRKASVHSPTRARPGELASSLRDALTRRGLTLATAAAGAGRRAALIEVYPHAAIIELMGLPRRLPYKVSRRSSYWPDAAAPQRLEWVALFLDALRSALGEVVIGVAEHLPSARALLAAGPRAKIAVLKGLEDALDAVVCAWAGCEYLAGRAVPFGDDNATIWSPPPRH